jgi:hypothetical protein
MVLAIPGGNQMRDERIDSMLLFYYGEVERCRDASAYFAGVIMLGSALETVLFNMCSSHYNDICTAGYTPKKQRGGRKPLKSWTLADMITVADKMGWLPRELERVDKDTVERAEVGDYADVVREMRNMIHLARYLDEGIPTVSAQWLQTVFNILHQVTAHLLYQTAQSRRRYLEGRGLWPPQRTANS